MQQGIGTSSLDLSWRYMPLRRFYAVFMCVFGGYTVQSAVCAEPASCAGPQFNLIQDNLKYFLEIIQNKKSDFLEYMIVILIAAEILVSLFDLWTRDAFVTSDDTTLPSPQR